MAKGTLTFKGDIGSPPNHYSKSIIQEVTDETALATLGTALAAHSTCNLAKTSLSASAIVNDTFPANGSNIDKKAIYYFRDPSDLSVHSITLPAPPAADWEEKDEGDRVTAAALASVVTAINTATGKSYTGLYGVVIQKR